MAGKTPEHIVVIRFSALGDAAMASPLLKEYARANPGVRFTMVSSSMLEPLFEGEPNLSYFASDLKGRHKGLKGLFGLFREIMSLKPTKVADINSVLRTFILRVLFTVSFVPLAFLRKGRSEKRALVSKKHKVLKPLISTVRRYELVLIKLGLKDLKFGLKGEDSTLTKPKRGYGQMSYIIGVAPFATHKGKIWPEERMEELVSRLSKDERFTIYLFGGGKREIAVLKGWEQKYSGVKSLAGTCSFREELKAIAQTDLMICMDSANMHFASCLQVPVISVWGATHIYAGFYGLGQSTSMAIQSSIECRPCSIFGKKECFRGDYACLNDITTDMAERRVLNFFAGEL